MIGQKILQFFRFSFPAKVKCNICGWKGPSFHSTKWQKFIICPRCQSQVRHRLFWAAINTPGHLNKKNLLENRSILHFAPEGSLIPHLRKLGAEYHTANRVAGDPAQPPYTVLTDIANMSGIENCRYDCVIAFDVLEHIPDDWQALREIHRILKDGGWCIITVPQKDNLQTTFEDSSITDTLEREKTFGQSDHLRIYGVDFKDRLEKSGFQVTTFDASCFSQENVARWVLFPPVLSDNPLATNFRRLYFGHKQLPPYAA